MSSISARAISRRWTWPPLSWCGYLCSTWPGSRFTVASDAATLLPPGVVREAAEVDVPQDAEEVVDLEDRVARAERVLEDALHAAVVVLAGPCP